MFTCFSAELRCLARECAIKTYKVKEISYGNADILHLQNKDGEGQYVKSLII